MADIPGITPLPPPPTPTTDATQSKITQQVQQEVMAARALADAKIADIQNRFPTPQPVDLSKYIPQEGHRYPIIMPPPPGQTPPQIPFFGGQRVQPKPTAKNLTPTANPTQTPIQPPPITGPAPTPGLEPPLKVIKQPPPQPNPYQTYIDAGNAAKANPDKVNPKALQIANETVRGHIEKDKDSINLISSELRSLEGIKNPVPSVQQKIELRNAQLRAYQTDLEYAYQAQASLSGGMQQAGVRPQAKDTHPEIVTANQYPFGYNPLTKTIDLPSGGMLQNVTGFVQGPGGELKEVILSQGGIKTTYEFTPIQQGQTPSPIIDKFSSSITLTPIAVQSKNIYANLATNQLLNPMTGGTLDVTNPANITELKSMGIHLVTAPQPLAQPSQTRAAAQSAADAFNAQTAEGKAVVIPQQTPDGWVLVPNPNITFNKDMKQTLAKYAEGYAKQYGAKVKDLGDGRFLVYSEQPSGTTPTQPVFVKSPYEMASGKSSQVSTNQPIFVKSGLDFNPPDFITYNGPRELGAPQSFYDTLASIGASGGKVTNITLDKYGNQIISYTPSPYGDLGQLTAVGAQLNQKDVIGQNILTNMGIIPKPELQYRETDLTKFYGIEFGKIASDTIKGFENRTGLYIKDVVAAPFVAATDLLSGNAARAAYDISPHYADQSALQNRLTNAGMPENQVKNILDATRINTNIYTLPMDIRPLSSTAGLLVGSAETLVKAPIAFGYAIALGSRIAVGQALGLTMSQAQREQVGSEFLAGGEYLKQFPFVAAFTIAGAGEEQLANAQAKGVTASGRTQLRTTNLDEEGNIVKEYNVMTQTTFKDSPQYLKEKLSMDIKNKLNTIFSNEGKTFTERPLKSIYEEESGVIVKDYGTYSQIISPSNPSYSEAKLLLENPPISTGATTPISISQEGEFLRATYKLPSVGRSATYEGLIGPNSAQYQTLLSQQAEINLLGKLNPLIAPAADIIGTGVKTSLITGTIGLGMQTLTSPMPSNQAEYTAQAQQGLNYLIGGFTLGTGIAAAKYVPMPSMSKFTNPLDIPQIGLRAMVEIGQDVYQAYKNAEMISRPIQGGGYWASEDFGIEPVSAIPKPQQSFITSTPSSPIQPATTIPRLQQSFAMQQASEVSPLLIGYYKNPPTSPTYDFGPAQSVSIAPKISLMANRYNQIQPAPPKEQTFLEIQKKDALQMENMNLAIAREAGRTKSEQFAAIRAMNMQRYAEVPRQATDYTTLLVGPAAVEGTRTATLLSQTEATNQLTKQAENLNLRAIVTQQPQPQINIDITQQPQPFLEPPPRPPLVGFPKLESKDLSGTGFGMLNLPKGFKKSGKRSLYSDLFSVGKSQYLFGKATQIPISKAKKYYGKEALGKIPTLELMQSKQRKAFKFPNFLKKKARK